MNKKQYIFFMGTLKIQLFLYPYLVSICFIDLNVLRIPKSQIYRVVNGDTFCQLKKFICS
jgi:hypothetical protein